MSTEDELLTTNEVAEQLHVASRTVARWARDGRVPAVRLPGGQLRFRRSDIDALVAAA